MIIFIHSTLFQILVISGSLCGGVVVISGVVDGSGNPSWNTKR